MKGSVILKIAVDIGMTAILLLLMAYGMVGEEAHEWLGIGMFGLFIIHHILNRKWSRNIFRGKYTLFRVWQAFLVVGIFLAMAGSMYSGIVLSEYALSFLPVNKGIDPRGIRQLFVQARSFGSLLAGIKGGWAFARILHMVSAYWGFVLMSLHLGLHWGMVMGMAKRFVKKIPIAGKWLLRGIAALIAGYGVYAFQRRDIWNYMVLRNHFAFFDFEEPVVFFLMDYAAVMVLFAWASHYFSNYNTR